LVVYFLIFYLEKTTTNNGGRRSNPHFVRICPTDHPGWGIPRSVCAIGGGFFFFMFY